MEEYQIGGVPVLDYVKGFTLGLTAGALITMVLYTTGRLEKLRKKKAKVMTKLLIACCVFVAVSFLAAVICSII